MNKYRIKYWLGSMITDWVGTADSEDYIIEKFRKIKGTNIKIISVEQLIERKRC